MHNSKFIDRSSEEPAFPQAFDLLVGFISVLYFSVIFLLVIN